MRPVPEASTRGHCIPRRFVYFVCFCRSDFGVRAQKCHSRKHAHRWRVRGVTPLPPQLGLSADDMAIPKQGNSKVGRRSGSSVGFSTNRKGGTPAARCKNPLKSWVARVPPFRWFTADGAIDISASRLSAVSRGLVAITQSRPRLIPRAGCRSGTARRGLNRSRFGCRRRPREWLVASMRWRRAWSCIPHGR